MGINPLLEWELDWIDENSHRCESVRHANLVKHNIIRRYLAREFAVRGAKAVAELNSILDEIKEGTIAAKTKCNSLYRLLN